MRTRASAVSCPQALCRDRKCPGEEEQGAQRPLHPGSPSAEQSPPPGGCAVHAGSRPHGGALGPHQQQLHWRPCPEPHSAGPGDAPTAAAPRWRPPSPWPWGARSPSCLQRQQTLSGRLWKRGQSAGREDPSRLQLPLTTRLLVLARLALLLEVTQLLRGDTQVTTGQMSQLTETLGPLAGHLEPGGWGPELRRWAGHPCGGGQMGGGVRQAGAEPPGEGRGSAGSPGTGLQPSDRMRSSRPRTPPGPVCPARRI